jgi:hypothetical protein
MTATELAEFRTLLQTVDPAELTNADCRAMLVLLRDVAARDE